MQMRHPDKPAIRNAISAGDNGSSQYATAFKNDVLAETWEFIAGELRNGDWPTGKQIPCEFTASGLARAKLTGWRFPRKVAAEHSRRYDHTESMIWPVSNV